MKLIQIRNKPKEWYDEENDKFREIIEESSIVLDFQDENNEVVSLHLTKDQFEKLKDREISLKISGGKNE
tara:strand:- start:848 stop:1057 length:210 start_codon:yes stop_codon:yes gene_type:complete